MLLSSLLSVLLLCCALTVPLSCCPQVLEHILRIDRVLRQPLGHLLLVGASGGGKTILSRFVSWMNGMSVFQIKVHKHYSPVDFDKVCALGRRCFRLLTSPCGVQDLRGLLTRAGCKGEKICFIFDESNVLGTAFLERMNALLAGGEVPGLFEGNDFNALMQECKETARREGISLETEDELFRRFTSEVQMNLHVVFTMNPSNDDFDNRSATSPALFNRCVIDWFGEWSAQALFQVGSEFTRSLDLSDVVLETKEAKGGPAPKKVRVCPCPSALVLVWAWSDPGCIVLFSLPSATRTMTTRKGTHCLQLVAAAAQRLTFLVYAHAAPRLSARPWCRRWCSCTSPCTTPCSRCVCAAALAGR